MGIPKQLDNAMVTADAVILLHNNRPLLLANGYRLGYEISLPTEQQWERTVRVTQLGQPQK